MNGQIVRCIKNRNSSAGSKAAMGHPCGGKPVFNHKGGFFLGLFHISIMKFPWQFEYICFMIFMNQRRILFHGLFRIKDPLQLFIFNFDQVYGLFCNLRGFSCHSSDLIPERTDLAFFYGRVVHVESHFHCMMHVLAC